MTTTAGYRARVEKANGCGGASNTMTLTVPRSTLPSVPDYKRSAAELCGTPRKHDGDQHRSFLRDIGSPCVLGLTTTV